MLAESKVLSETRLRVSGPARPNSGKELTMNSTWPLVRSRRFGVKYVSSN